MDQITIRQTSAELPSFDEEAGLEPVSQLGAESSLVADFQFADATVPALVLANAHLLHGKIRALNAGQATISAARMDSVEFTGCSLSSLRWTGGKLSRVRFDTCKFLGARFEGVTMEHVVFANCKLDYAALDQIRAAGPVLFAGCSLREAELTGCDLAGSLFDGCDLRLTGFGPGHYRRCDLRGNDLSALTGASHLKHVIIDHAQAMQLGEALAAELEVTFGKDLPDCLSQTVTPAGHGWASPSHRVKGAGRTACPGAELMPAWTGATAPMIMAIGRWGAGVTNPPALPTRAAVCSSSGLPA